MQARSPAMKSGSLIVEVLRDVLGGAPRGLSRAGLETSIAEVGASGQAGAKKGVAQGKRPTDVVT